MLEKALTGNRLYWGWLALLLVVVAVGLVFYWKQLSTGLGITGMSRDVSWGLYIANFTFFVGIAASAVVLILPYYLHNQKAFARLVVLGEFLAVVAVTVSMLFVVVDLGQPSRVFNLFLHPSPTSVLFWDVIVLSIYLLLSIIIGWSTLDAEHKSEMPRPWIKPLILISIPLAISIHTVTALIYSGLEARPFWFTALMAPRFLASAFASGPALLLIIVIIIKRLTRFTIGKEAIQKVATIITYALILSMFFFLLELFTAFYGGVPEHLTHFQYLLFGLGNGSKLVPLAWLSIGLFCASIVLLLIPLTRNNESILLFICVFIIISIWIDKGLGLIIPGFIPNPMGEVYEYWPTIPEAFITIGVWAIGLLLLTVLYKVVISVRDQIRV